MGVSVKGVHTSKRETKEADIIAKASPKLKVGTPHWKGTKGRCTLYKCRQFCN